MVYAYDRKCRTNELKFCFYSNIIVYTLCSRLHNDTLNTLSVNVGGTSDTIISRDPNALSYINQLCFLKTQCYFE